MTLQQVSQYFSKWYGEQLEPWWFRRRRPQRLATLGVQDVVQLPQASLLLGDADDYQRQPLCRRYQRYYRQFLHQDQAGALWQDPAGIAMLLPLGSFADAAGFSKQLKKKSGNVWRDAEKARRNGFLLQLFLPANHSPDLLALRRSRKMRAFGPVLDAFTVTLADLGGAPQQWQALPTPQHTDYWDCYLGVFLPKPGHQQGDVMTDQQLIGYTRLHRIGNAVRYAELMGHGGFQAAGVMSVLHHDVLCWLLDPANPLVVGIEYLSYGALEQGGDGLVFWKRKALFQPMRLVLPPRPTVATKF